MKIEQNKNNCVIDIKDTDVRTLTDEEIKQIVSLVLNNTTVVIHKHPDMTTDEYRAFTHRMGKVQTDGAPGTGGVYHLPGSDNEILRVTGAKDENGNNLGIFAQKEELLWHCAEPGKADRNDIFCLYGIQGTQGSITSYTNSQLAYLDLLKVTDAPEGLIDSLHQLEAYYDFNLNLDDVTATLSKPNYTSTKGQFPIVIKNKSGKQGIYISPKQRPLLFKNGVELDRKTKYKYVSFLYDFLTQEKYVYDHHWTDGDIVLNCQWHSLHKRNHFEQVEQRLLWRIMINV
jgi:alpha-ketoglutarate-dependent taurine dioxygenase